MVGIPVEQLKQKSTSSDTIPPSFLTLQFDQQPLLRRLALRMQRPTVFAEVGFILAVAKFALPDFALSGGDTGSPSLKRRVNIGQCRHVRSNGMQHVGCWLTEPVLCSHASAFLLQGYVPGR